MIRVGLADDQALFLAGIAMVVSSQADMEVAWQAEDGQVAIERCAEDPVDVILMDVQMPRLDGIVATRRVLGDHPETRVIMLTTFDDEQYVVGGLAAGASGFLLKDAEPEGLLRALRTVHAGDAVISPRATKRIVTRLDSSQPRSAPLSRTDRALIDALTPRELEVLISMARGWSNTEISERLFISMPTVKTHVGRVLTKLDARDRVHAAIFAFRTGLVGRDDLLGD